MLICRRESNSNTDNELDTNNDHDNSEDMEQMATLLVKGFKKMVYKNFKKGRRFFRKGSSSSNYDKRNNRRCSDRKESKSGKLDKSKERCYNCDGIGNFAADCRKPKVEKKQGLIPKKKNWDDSSDSYDGINYALMENVYTEADNAELKEILENGCWGSGLGYANRSIPNKKIKKETEKNKPIHTDTKVKLNKAQLKTIKFNPSVDAINQLMRGHHVNFGEEHCEIVSNTDGKIAMTGVKHGTLYEARKAKKRKTSFKSKTESSILEPYRILHIDLYGPVNVMSIAKKRYALVIVVEYTRYTWVYFPNTKDESPSILLDHVRELEKGSTHKVKIIRSDNETEFKNSSMEEFYKLKGIKQEFSAPEPPQQNGFVERKNRTLIEAARTMLEEGKLPTYFWAEAVQTVFFTQNATLINRHGKHHLRW
ncbi:hypothetical protein AgCh_009536 [Apium graveolens]